MSALWWLLVPGRAAWAALALGLLQAWGASGWAVVRLLLAHAAAYRARQALWQRALVGLALLADRCHGSEWSGQDCACTFG